MILYITRSLFLRISINVFNIQCLFVFFSCPNKEIVLPSVDTYVKVHQAHEPLISITGTKVHQSTLANLRIGQRIFHDLHIGVDVIMDDDLPEDDESHVHYSHTLKASKLNAATVKKNLDLKTRRLDYKMSKSLKLRK